MSVASDEVLILTLELDATNFEWLNALRGTHFPRERNFLAAHLTLFHRLSIFQGESIAAMAAAHGVVDLTFTGIRRLGGGVAIDAVSPQLHRLRAELARGMPGETSRQDQQPFRPHVTVQNKVTPAAARALANQLQAGFIARQGSGPALLLWRYDQGPWTLLRRIALGET